MPENCLFSFRTVDQSGSLLDWGSPAWDSAEAVLLKHQWDGSPTPSPLATQVRSLWNRTHLFFSFDCRFERLLISPELGSDGPLESLWEFDVVEVFLRPTSAPDYFEYEVSPLGQWLDVHVIRPRKNVDFNWRSEMESTVDLDREGHLWRTRMALPYKPMNLVCPNLKTPEKGEIWRANLFRLAGQGDERHYLCWQPTLTPEPDFHIPAAFGNLLFQA
jgi:alpha-galactosidase